MAGVLQAAVVLDDPSLNYMMFKQWQPVILHKVQGNWDLLHELLYQDQSLDFFSLFRCYSGFMGQHGQPNYAAANTSLDAFVLYRHSLGLPASVLDSGVMEDIGFVSNMNNLSKPRKASSIRVARAGSARSNTVDDSAPNSQARAMSTGHESNSKGFKKFLSECRSRPAPSDLAVSIALLAQEAETTLKGFRIRCDEDLDLNVPLSSLVWTAW
ncbi:MAG: hypothetical protein Q9215_007139 [Flavoplaca cf. flavocitrina]